MKKKSAYSIEYSSKKHHKSHSQDDINKFPHNKSSKVAHFHKTIKVTVARKNRSMHC